MSNLFFKSESEKTSVKSGSNFVSKRVFKAFLLMSMMLLSWNGWAQGYTVIYPDGQTMAEPGNVVTVVFNEDISNFVYADDNEGDGKPHENKTNRTANFLLGGNDWNAKDPGDPASGYSSTFADIIEYQSNTLKIKIPETDDAIYKIHYGTKAEYKGELVFVWQWMKYFYYGGVIEINVVTEDFVIRTLDSKCVLPGNYLPVMVENNPYGDDLLWSYSSSGKSGSLVVSKVNDKTYNVEIPQINGASMTITCKGTSADAKMVSLDNILICLPSLNVRSCAAQNDDVIVTLGDNYSPYVSYEIYEKKTENNSESYTKICSFNETETDAEFNVGKFEEKSSMGSKYILPKNYVLYINGEKTNKEFTITKCDVTLNCGSYSPGTLIAENCSLSFDVLDDKLSVSQTGGKAITDKEHQNFIVNEGIWESTYNKDLQAGNRYKVRTNIYVDGANVGYCESEEFEVRENVKPVITTTAENNKDFGCNPTIEAPKFSVTDNCDADISSKLQVTAAPIEENGCIRSQTWIATATDVCGNEAEAVSITYTWTEDKLPPTIEIEDQFLTVNADVNGPCVFVVPDLTEIVKEKSLDKCTAQEDLLVTQTPAAGEEITQTTDVIVEVRDKCNKISSVTIKVIVPDALSLENFSQQKTMTCSDGKPHATISSSVSGGVAPYTITVTKDETPLSEKSQELQTAGNFSIADLELGEYKVTVSDVNGCAVTKEVSVTFTPQELTITGENIEKIYNGQPQSAEATAENYQVEGLLKGDEITSITFIQDNPLTDVGEISYSIKDVEISREGVNVTCFYDIAATGAMFKVVPRQVTLTSSDSTKVYDGTALTNSTVTVGGDGFATGEGATYDVTGTQTEVGSSANAFSYTLNSNTKADNYTITKVEGTLTVTELTEKVTVTITENSGSEKYDGAEKTVTGYEVTSISNSLYTEDCFTFSGDATVKGTDAGSYAMELKPTDFTNISKNFSEVEFVIVDGTLEISKRTVTLTSATQEKVYDGTALTNANVAVGGDGFATGEGATYDVTGTQTEVGSSNNTFTYTLNEGTKADNYTISTKAGTLTVTALTEKVTVTITENSGSEKYDGAEKTVTGYEVTSISNSLYTEDCFTFSGDATVKGTDAGSYAMELKPTDFTNISKNFSEVEFVIVDGTLEISKRTVTLTSLDSTKVYDGEALTNDEVTVSGDGFADGEGASYDVTGTQTEVGETANAFTYTLNEGTKADNYTITTTEGTLTVTALTDKVTVTITENSGSEKYDGTEKIVTGYKVTNISNSLYTTDDFLFNGNDKVVGTDAGTYNMELKSADFTNNSKNFSNVEFVIVDGTLEITKRTVMLSSATAEMVYNGTALTNTTVTVGGDGFVAGEAIVSVTGSQTEVGSSSNTIVVEEGENFKAENYLITKEEGTLEVTMRTVTVIITGHTDKKVYNGSAQEVSGYEVVISDDLYKEDYIEFAGDSIANGTNVGEYPMGLTTEAFSNTNNNFNVEFTVVDGLLTILTTEKVIVTITENSDIITYDGKIHTISGYKVDISNSLYTEADFAFHGDSLISGMNVGSYHMELKPEDFENLNKNFEVEFVITDNSLVIEPLNVIVEIVGNSAKEFYNKEEHEVSGYTWSSDSELYTVNDFEFSGDSVLTETNVGSYVMNLVETQFVNNNKNFNVTFSVTDGSLTIDKLSTIVTIVGNSVTKTFNGSEYMLSGYTWSADSEVYTEDDFMFNGDSIVVGTIVGSYPMDLNLNDFINLNDNIDVTFVVEDGELIVSELDIVVTIAGNTRTTNYNGISQSVLGYTWSANYDDYTESDFTFNGDSIAYGINVGTYPMNMTAEQFQNLNPNFGKVTFVIEDGNITIEPMIDEVLVQIYGYVEDVLYDGKEHTVSGYSVFSNNNLYGVGDFEFHGEELLKGVNAGVYQMGLSQDQFVNTNENFANVRFEVADGTLRINKRTVLLESESATRNYNGEVLSRPIVKELKDGFAEGEGATYEFYNDISFAGSVENDFSYTLNEGTLVDNYIIEQNNGLLSISPIREIIDIVANSAEKYHDGSVLVDSGYTYTENVLVDGDTLIVEIVGEITEVGTIANEIVSYKVMRGDVDVTDNYTFGSIKNGVLRVLYVQRPVVVYAKNGKIAVHNANKYVYVHDMLSRLVYIHNSPTIYVTDYDEFEVPCTGTYLVRIGDESYKVVVQKK